MCSIVGLLVLDVVGVSVLLVFIILFCGTASSVLGCSSLGRIVCGCFAFLCNLEGLLRSLVSESLGFGLGLPLALLLLKALLLSLLLPFLLHDQPDLLIFGAVRPRSRGGCRGSGTSSGGLLGGAEPDEGVQSLEEQLVQEFLDQAPQLARSGVDPVLEPQGQLQEKLLELKVHKLNSLDVDKVLAEYLPLPVSVQPLELSLVSGLSGLVIKLLLLLLFSSFFRLLLILRFLLALKSPLFSSLLCLLQSLLPGSCLLVRSEQHWVGPDVGIKLVLL